MLMVYPAFEPSYWGMQYSLSAIGRKALMPPLGLLTVAAMTPPEYDIRLVDLNTEPLTEKDIAGADVVLFSAMLVQKEGLMEAAQRCRAAGKLVVFGGPYPTACPEECAPYCDVLVLDEAEITWPLFLGDLAAGEWKATYRSSQKPDIRLTPAPRFDLLRIQDYVSIPIQFSRGCPYQCEFCDIVVLFGRHPRTKTPAQVLRELDALLATGYRGRVFIVDDNFIGNKREVMKLLGELIRWNREHGNPFSYGTEASVNLADDRELLRQMASAGFVFVFLGIETPSLDSLRETRKHHNVGGSLLERVQAVQEAGLIVYGGFIVGFDNDPEDIFERQIEFIDEAAIANAMIGPLMALPGTPLFERMRRENRLLSTNDYGSWYESGYTNIVTRIPRRKLLKGHRRIVQTIYDPDRYFDRALRGLQRLPRYRSRRERREYFRWLVNAELKRSSGAHSPRPSPVTMVKFFVRLYKGFPLEFRKPLRRFLWQVVRTCPEQLPRTLSFILMGYHCYRYTQEYILPKIDEALSIREAPEPANFDPDSILMHPVEK
jgi:radical SAM superfamily enzyme YgiQ (UPF0313 family)